MKVSASGIHPNRRVGSSSTIGMGGRIRVNNARKPLSMPKTGILSQRIENFLAGSSTFDANVYLRILSNKKITLDKVPLNVFASQPFIWKCLDQRPKELIAHMNSWNSEQMLYFIEKYDVLPEAMFGRLFSEGLNPTLIPGDIRLSLPFLRVAANANPGKLAESLKKENIQSVRLALRDLDDELITNLWKNGMPTVMLPAKKSSNDEFVARIRAANPKRFEDDIQNYAVNAMLRSKVEQYSLSKRAASV
ncbi:MAG: hypothetical protein LBE98_04350 [Puniceicoccales bacterium]|jgi:hypothetical protein|nr:hypothetical protein [Puniceicoccales bacterium]